MRATRRSFLETAALGAAGLALRSPWTTAAEPPAAPAKLIVAKASTPAANAAALDVEARLLTERAITAMGGSLANKINPPA